MGLIILELLRIESFMYCFDLLLKDVEKRAFKKFLVYSGSVSILCAILKYMMSDFSMMHLMIKIIILIFYIKLYYKGDLLFIFCNAFGLYVFWDILNVVAIFVTFPFAILGDIKTDTILLDIVLILGQGLLYFLVIFWIKLKKCRVQFRVSIRTQIGFIFIFGVIESVIIRFKNLKYDFNSIILYRELLFLIFFGTIVFILWISDKRAEEKRFRELTSYAHKTREVLPSVSRVLNRIEDLTDQTAESAEILKELRAICQADMQETQKEMSNIKTFDSTGSIILNEQLERYLEEAAEQDFNLDIIVRAPVRGILEEKKIEIYKLLQVVGDLYRNAHKVVAKRKDGGMILICFGYNLEGFYEISVYDNGEMFPGYVLKHFGERGVTTGGTGHGIADILEALAENKNSFVLNQSLPEGSIFTKGISIVFDGKGRIEKSNSF